MKTPKLSDLIVSEGSVDETLIYNILVPYINILKNDKKIVPKEVFLELSVEKKILVWFLGRKAMVKLKIIENEDAGPNEVADGTATKIGSVKPNLRDLHKKGLLESKKGKYKITSLGVFELKGKMNPNAKDL